MPYELPDLPYPHDALEPHIDEETMRLHHGAHHATYVKKVNDALAGTRWEDLPIHEVLASLDALPDDIRTVVRNNGGGHANHSLFWTIMGPGPGGDPPGRLGEMIAASFGGVADFRARWEAAAAGVFGSGWVWLVPDGDGLAITTTPNQDTPLMSGVTPLMGLDVWEHAYYLSYRNRRPEYAAAWWNVVDWDAVAARLETLAT